MLDRLLRLPATLRGQLRLLREDPERLGRNLLQVVNPAEYEARLLDIVAQPPLHLHVASSASAPVLNVLQPVLTPDSMTGGPNTVLLLAAQVAGNGAAVRIVTNRTGHRPDPSWFRDHMSGLLGHAPPPGLELAVASDPAAPLAVGADDLWVATHWTTAQGLKPVLGRMRRSWFLYMIQDFEPGFYPWSSNHALALETYAMPHRAVINEGFLADHLVAMRAGRYADPAAMTHGAISFEPAVDRAVFHPPPTPGAARPRRLLVYGRPTNPRNMFGLAVGALRAALATGAFESEWEFLALGGRGSLPDLALDSRHRLRPAPWDSYGGYADTLRAADILLCPMLSPHTSYPVLEMAACGGIVVTNSHGPKTPEALAALSPDIIAGPPTQEALAEGLLRAATLARDPARRRADRLRMPASWKDALAPAARFVAAALRDP